MSAGHLLTAHDLQFGFKPKIWLWWSSLTWTSTIKAFDLVSHNKPQWFPSERPRWLISLLKNWAWSVTTVATCLVGLRLIHFPLLMVSDRAVHCSFVVKPKINRYGKTYRPTFVTIFCCSADVKQVMCNCLVKDLNTASEAICRKTVVHAWKPTHSQNSRNNHIAIRITPSPSMCVCKLQPYFSCSRNN